MNESAHSLNVNVTLDRDSAQPVRAQILSQLRQAIRDGVLVADDPLPSTRSLAAALGVSRTTVTGCYLELEGDGWITSTHGAGTFVAPRARSDGAPPVPVAPDSGCPAHELRRYDLRPGGVDPSIVSPDQWRRLWRHVTPSATAAHPCGIPDLRAALAAYLGHARGLQCVPGEIIVCAGTAEAVSIVSAALGWPGKTVAMEDPGYPAIRNILRRSGIDVAGLDVTEPAVIPELLAGHASLSGVYLTPSHQYPLGHRLSEELRRVVIRWADRTAAVVIEDDYDGEFSFGIAPSTSMAGASPTSNVVFVGTLSKVLDPGLRLAYLRVPPHLVAAVACAREDFGSTVPTAVQSAAATFIASGELSRHIARARRIYADRRRVLLSELQRFPAVSGLIGIDAGLHVVASLRPGVESATVVAQARERGVDLVDLDDFRMQPLPDRPGLVFGYSAHPAAAIRRAMHIVGDCPGLAGAAT